MLTLIPRLNYKYTIKDAITSLLGLFKKNIEYQSLPKIFSNDNLFFVNHARTGIRLALNSLNLPPGARIGVQAFNCYTVFNAIHHAGYNHEFIDVTDDFQIDINDLKKKSSKIDVLIVTHLFGIPCQMDKVKSVIQKIPIIEDCAHSFLSEYKGKLTGKLGSIAVFSIGKGKFPSIGQGGFILVNNQKYFDNIKTQVKKLEKYSLLAELMEVFKNYILHVLHLPLIYAFFTFPVLKNLDRKKDLGGKYRHNEKQIAGVNYSLFEHKLNNIHALLSLQSKNGNEISSFTNLIGNSPYHYKYEITNDFSYFMIPVLIKADKEKLISVFHHKGIEISAHFSNSIQWAKKFGYSNGYCPNVEKIIEEVVAFSCHYNLKNKYVTRTKAILKQYASIN